MGCSRFSPSSEQHQQSSSHTFSGRHIFAHVFSHVHFPAEQTCFSCIQNSSIITSCACIILCLLGQTVFVQKSPQPMQMSPDTAVQLRCWDACKFWADQATNLCAAERDAWQKARQPECVSGTSFGDDNVEPSL